MKKDETRFTIRFCPVDPRHRLAVEALNAAGRRKASLIAEAVCRYLAQHGDYKDTAAHYDIFLQSGSSAALAGAEAASVPVTGADYSDEPEVIISAGEIYDDGSGTYSEGLSVDAATRQAILGGLNMFNSGETDNN